MTWVLTRGSKATDFFDYEMKIMEALLSGKGIDHHLEPCCEMLFLEVAALLYMIRLGENMYDCTRKQKAQMACILNLSLMSCLFEVKRVGIIALYLRMFSLSMLLLRTGMSTRMR